MHLVRANNVRRSKRLNRRQRPNDRVLLGHLLGSEREAGRDDGGETFGDSSDGEGDGDLRVAVV
jgi:hypothetical protein